MNSAAALHNFWHGNVETSTDTLVPVIESHPNGGSIVISPSSIDDLPVLPKPNDLVNGSSALPPLLIHRNGDLKPRILPEVHHTSSKLRAAPSNTTANNINNGNSQTMNDNVVIQPEYQRMNINGAGNVNLNAFNATAAAAHSSSLYRRRRNSSNSRQSPMDLISPNGVSHRPANGRYNLNIVFQWATSFTLLVFLLHLYSISPILSTRFSTPAVASLPPTPSGSRPLLSQIATPVAITCPDGLAPALSEQNLRLQQIVYEAKVGTTDGLFRSSHKLIGIFLTAERRSLAEGVARHPFGSVAKDQMQHLQYCSSSSGGRNGMLILNNSAHLYKSNTTTVETLNHNILTAHITRFFRHEINYKLKPFFSNLVEIIGAFISLFTD